MWKTYGHWVVVEGNFETQQGFFSDVNNWVSNKRKGKEINPIRDKGYGRIPHYILQMG